MTPFKRAGLVLAIFCGLAMAGTASAQVISQPPVQHFVVSTMAGSFGGSPVSIESTGIQLVQQPAYALSVAYEYISNPNDPSKPRVGSGVANYTFMASKLVPSSIRKKLLIDLTNYNVTLQAGAGVESLFTGAGAARSQHVVGNFAAYGSYSLPGGHVQIGLGAKFIVGPQGGLVKVPAGQLNFVF